MKHGNREKNVWKDLCILSWGAAGLLLCAGLFLWPGFSRAPETEAPSEAAERGAFSGAGEPSAGSAVPAGSDDPLLTVVNAETPLPDDWATSLVPVAEDSEALVDSRVYDDLWAMTNDARDEGVWFWVASGWRSRELQESLFSEKIREYVAQGMDEAEAERETLRTIQRPGHSEHETGLAVDFDDASDGFEDTEGYRWLAAHGAEYGFVQRYKRGKETVTGIDCESWHFRYVGREHAQRMEELGLCLEEYVSFLESGTQ